ncbi:MAG: hypothetical protein COV01_03415 [Candidatus Taylorbacteria bacterium CG10_big_fil_rev_8_21_14_0_10_41_48]|uniref:Uncharacterized protein n=1 Tax=Candidatus Taylorbacteria bacterium CG10_big_fil_rev_8_21_14_0_10_41_48 TaxID=1975024 RepID=A0A2M8LB66_9BACT|nr:MAG: hypothetical protein COV01_03415 [Candidatus Taylorbacteria bacterium CG10_big_fil_rev_8_21_14_0_10_41_48]
MNVLTKSVLQQKEGEIEKWLVEGSFLKPGQRAEVSIRIINDKAATLVICKGRKKCRMDDLTDKLTGDDWNILLSAHFHEPRLNEMVRLFHSCGSEGLSLGDLKAKGLDHVQWFRDMLMARKLPFKIRAANNTANRSACVTTIYKIYKIKTNNPA